MRILLVTRGSQGDIYPFIALARGLEAAGHTVTFNAPQMFEDLVRRTGLTYVPQEKEDIGGMMVEAAGSTQKTKRVLKWMRAAIDMQFRQLVPLMAEHDLLIAANTEFAAASVAEYCGKPVIRTAFGPFLPSRTIPPAVMPFPKPGRILRPMLFWKLLNRGTNFMVRKTINRNRVALGMEPVRNFGYHTAGYCDNFLLYSPSLGNTDPEWSDKYKWAIGGYSFHDSMEYDPAAYDELMAFIRRDDRPTLFFTLGSCSDRNRDRFCAMLAGICRAQDYKLVVGSGWSKTGTHLTQDDSFYLLTKPIPHNIILPHCTAAIHHGGCGTTHSMARAGIPQMVAPIFVDQYYWGYRVEVLGLGPRQARLGRISREELEKRVTDLMTNPQYRENAAALGEKMAAENGPEALCRYIGRNWPDAVTGSVSDSDFRTGEARTKKTN
ncbi:MAG: glycosyltransferase [Rikenellaceae bacterium]|nr:glycosyltransferase [Rikenellaceae bacterium]